MRKLRAWCRRILNMFQKERLDRDFAEELESHLELDIDDGIRSGLSPEEARRQALMRLGGIEQVKEAHRDRRGIAFIEELARDLFYAFRMMRSHPGFTAAVILTLGLGIGATTAIFSVVNGILLRPLPYPEPERLVSIGAIHGGRPDPFTYTEDYSAFRDHNRTLSSIAGYYPFQVNFAHGDHSERITGALATRSLFEMLGVQPRLGRNFLPEEDTPGGPAAAILGENFWRSRLGADPAVIGKTVELDGMSYQVIGVLSAEFRLPGRENENSFSLWLPFAIENGRAARDEMLMFAIGRLKAGTTPQQATADLQALQQVKLRRVKRSIRVSDWQNEISRQVKTPLLIFACAVACVLLIACVNVANLLLSRAATREKEIAVRRTLGAGRLRVVRQLLTESAVMGLIGGLFGLILAYWGKDLLVEFLAPNLPLANPILLDGSVLVFNVAAALVTGIAFGLAPALEISRADMAVCLKEAGRSASESAPRRRMRALLVVSEVALATVLLVGAGLLLRSFISLRSLEGGYETGHVLTVTVDLTPSKYPNAQAQASFFSQALANIQSLPGVTSAGGAMSPPFSGYSMMFSGLTMEGRPQIEGYVCAVTVTPDYFRALGIPLIRGRYLTAGDRQGAPSAVLVNESFARRVYPDGNCLGRRIRSWIDRNDWMTIVGVVQNVRTYPEKEPEPTIYPSYLQAGGTHMTLVLRIAGEPMALVPAVRSAIARVDGSQPPHDIMTLEAAAADYFTPRRVNMALVAAFALLALALGAIGIYGVLSYSVRRRTHEIGIQLALGAEQGRILGAIMKNGLSLTAAGIAIGLAAAFGLTRFISSELWGISATDPFTYVVVAAVVATTASAACLIPARRAAKLDPILALRRE